MKGSRRGGVGVAAAAACVDGGGPESCQLHRTGTAGTWHCGYWQEKVDRGSWRKYGADRGADQDLWVHTGYTREKEKG